MRAGGGRAASPRSRLAACVAAAACLVLPARAAGALFVIFSPSHVAPGDRVEVRTGNTPADFDVRDRKLPLQPPITVYLVPNEIAGEVLSRHDSRLERLGVLEPDKDGKARAVFVVPDLPGGRYAAAFFCPGCAAYSRGATFFALKVDEGILPEYRDRIALVVEGDSGLGTFAIVGAAGALAVAGWIVRRRLRRAPARGDRIA